MTTLNNFKLSEPQSQQVQTELYPLFSQDPEASFQRMVDIAAEKGVTLTVDEVKGFLKQMDEDSEFDDIELDAVALAAVAGGYLVKDVAAKRKRMTSHGVVALHASDAQVVIRSAAFRSS